MNDLYETLRKLVRQELSTLRVAELATVQQVHPADPDNYSCTVALRDAELVLNKVPLATPRKGFASVPDVGDLVLVQFVGGDLNRPVIVGSLYNDEDRPPENKEKQLVIHLPVDADAGSAVRVEVSESPLQVKINVGSTVTLTLKDSDPPLTIDVGDGQATLSVAQSGAVKLESGGEFALKAGGNVKIEAGGTLDLKGAVINLN